jgi:hypothetical protein
LLLSTTAYAAPFLEVTAGADNQFRHEAPGGQYLLHLPTRSLSPGTWRLRLDLGDGVSRAVLIVLRN